MEKIYIGYVQGVHGLRGDLKIKCHFESPEMVFKKNNKIYLNDEEHIITNTKFYKGFYLTTIDNLKDINLVEKYKGFDVYFKREDLSLKEDEYILDDLFGLEIISHDRSYGKVTDILSSKAHDILSVEGEKKVLIPLIDEYVKKVDLQNGKIFVEGIEGLFL